MPLFARPPKPCQRRSFATLLVISIEVRPNPLEIDPTRSALWSARQRAGTNAIKHPFQKATGTSVGASSRLAMRSNWLSPTTHWHEREGHDGAPEKRGSYYVAIFVRQLGASSLARIGNCGKRTSKVRLPALLVPQARRRWRRDSSSK